MTKRHPCLQSPIEGLRPSLCFNRKVEDLVSAGVAALIALGFAGWFARLSSLRRRLEKQGVEVPGRVTSATNHRNPTTWIAYGDAAGQQHKFVVMKSIARGADVQVFYDANNPSQAMLKQARWNHLHLLWGVVLPGALAGNILGLW